MKRAERRAHYYRLKKKRQWYYGFYLTMDDPRLGSRVETCPDCSCTGCGNPRRHFGHLTIQEYKALLSYADAMEDHFGYKVPFKMNTMW